MNIKQVKSKGRGGDTTVAHLTPGEVVLPQHVAAKLQKQISQIMGRGELSKRTVGSSSTSVNPTTGLEEFFFHNKQRKKAERNIAAQLAASEKRMKAEMESREKNLQEMFDTQLAEQQRESRKMKAETDLMLQKQKVETIRAGRAISQKKKDIEQGRSIALSEVGTTSATELSSPRYSSQRTRRKASFTSSAVPTLQIGGQYRPT